MKKILYIFLTLLSVQVSAQIEQPRIKFDQVIKDSTGSGRIVISSLDDSSMIYSPDFFINTADSLLILFGDTVQAGSAVDAAQVRDIIYATIDAGLGIEIDTSSQIGILTIQSLSIEDSVYNSTGVEILKGTPLYVTGIQGNYWSVEPAQANDPTKMPVVAIAGENIPAGQQGLGLLKGHIKGVNTETFASGDEVWVGATGGYTNIKPKGEGVLVQKLGTVIKANANGSGIINLGEVQYNLNPNNIFIGGADSVQTTINLPTVLSDSLNNYVTIAGTETITGAKTFTSDLDVDAKIALNAGDDNIVIGDGAGANLVSGQSIRNILIGTSAGAVIDSGDFNVAVGYQALFKNTTGNQNIANGYEALRSNTTGNNNVANGRDALYSNTTGYENVANGFRALFSNTTGYTNVANGVNALYSLSSGSDNQAYGLNAGRYLSDGSTALTTATGSFFLGTNTRASANGNSNEIVIGTNAIGNGSNTITIGSSTTQSLHTRNYEFDIDQTVGGATDNYVLTYDSLDGQISLEPRVESAAFQQQFPASGTSYTVTTADLPVDINNVLVFQNGQVLDKTMFTKSGNTITLNFQPEVGDRIIVMWFKGDIVDIGGNYVTLDQTETITGAKTFTNTFTQSGGDVNFNGNTFFVDASANRVGIGTTSPNAKMQVDFSNYETGLLFNNTNTQYALIAFQALGNTKAFIGYNSGNGFFGGESGTGTIIQANGQYGMYMDTFLNIYLGSSIVAPTAKLDVDGNIKSSGSLTLGTPLSVANGGTGSATQNFVDLSSAQTVGGAKTFTSTVTGTRFDPTSSSTTGNGMFLPTTNILGFSTNGSERMRIEASGNVLVGTTNADVGGSVTGINLRPYGAIQASNDLTGTQSAPFYSDRRGTNNTGPAYTLAMGGFYKADIGIDGTNSTTNDASITFNTISYNTTRTERMRITSAGNVGIGTTTDAGYKLDVNGTMRVSGASTFGNITAANIGLGASSIYPLDIQINGSNTPVVQRIKNTGTNTNDDALLYFSTQSSRDFSIGLDRSSGLFNFTSGAASVSSGILLSIEAIAGAATFSSSVTAANLYSTGASNFATSGGNVGIGTTNPVARLHAASNAAGAYGGIIYNTNATGEGLTIRGGSSSSQNALVVQTYNGGQELLTVRSDGNVGIGTSSPSSLLHTRFVNNTAGERTIAKDVLTVEAQYNGGDGQPYTGFGGQIAFVNETYHGSSSHKGATIGGIINDLSYTDDGTSLVFSTALTNTSSPLERMRIHYNGNVGIGEASPDSKLEVNGSATNTNSINTSSDTINYSLSNIAYTDSESNIITLTNIKDGGAYTLISTATNVSSELEITATNFDIKYMGTVPRTYGKRHIYSFIVAGTDVYVTMGTQN